MKFRILLLSLMMFSCGGDKPTGSKELEITVEDSHVQIENGYPFCVFTIKKDGRSFSDNEEVRFVAEFFRDDDSIGTDDRAVGGIPGNGKKTTIAIGLNGGRNSNPDRCDITSIQLAQ